MNKDVKKILFVVALYGLANGLFYNFQQLCYLIMACLSNQLVLLLP